MIGVTETFFMTDNDLEMLDRGLGIVFVLENNDTVEIAKWKEDDIDEAPNKRDTP